MSDEPANLPVALDLRDHVAFDLDVPQMRPITAGGGLRLDLVCLEPKQILPAATIDGDRLYTVIGGRAWAVVEDAEVVLEALQALLVPAGAAHGLRNESPDPLIVQVVTAAPGAGPVTGPAEASAAGEASEAITADSSPTPPTPPATSEVAGRDRHGARSQGSDRFRRIRRILGSGD